MPVIPSPDKKTVTTLDLIAMKQAKTPIVATTAYDAMFARLVDDSGVDVILVGDSVNQVIAGEPSTISATVDQMIYHGKAVRKGVKNALLVIDMPFLSYQVNAEDALRNCGRVMKETGAQAVKLEGGQNVAATVHALVNAGIPVMGHVGLTPQSVHALGGYKVQGKTEESARRLEADAHALQDAGCFAMVLELVPAELSGKVSQGLTIPTIGIGAGPHCDGQVLVLHDLLGLNDRFSPKFLKKYANFAEETRRALKEFGDDVRKGKYPDKDHSF